MSAYAVHQFLPRLDPGDAASTHSLHVQRVLREMDLESEIYTETAHDAVAHHCSEHHSYSGGPVLYQFAIGSVLADKLGALSTPLAINYHNLTPARFFETWDPPLVHGTAWGRHQLDVLAPRTDLAISVSAYNDLDLQEAGYQRTAVAPILFDPATFEGATDYVTLERLLASKRSVDWLFVGRIVPNKAQHDVIKAFAAYRGLHDPDARLFLVGGASSASYEQAFRGLVQRLGLTDVVTFTGPVPAGVLHAHFRAADVFVCLSDHEGFCVPLLEAMFHDLPIVAFAEAAIPETLGAAGVLLPEKHPALVAAAVAKLAASPALRRALVAAGRVRLAELSLANGEAAFKAAITPWLEAL